MACWVELAQARESVGKKSDFSALAARLPIMGVEQLCTAHKERSFNGQMNHPGTGTGAKRAAHELIIIVIIMTVIQFKINTW